MRTIKFVSPLNIRLDDHEYEYFNEDEMPDVSPTEAIYYAEEITEAIERSRLQDDSPRGLMAYFDDNPTIAAKVHSAYPSIGIRNGHLMGVMVCEVKGHLNESETAELEDYFTGQYSDGWGESFEQHEIKTSNGDLYVHFWDSRNFEITVEDDAPALLKSTEQKSKFAVSIERIGNTDKERTAVLNLPATGPQIRDAFDRAGVTDIGEAAVKTIAYGRDYLSVLIPITPDLYELNYLAERLAEQAPHEKLFYKAVVKMETSMPDMKRLINLTGHLENCQIAPAKNDAELGRFYAENDFIPELASVSDEVFNMLDFTKIGKDMRESEHGVYLDGCYIVQPVSPEALEDFYHGDAPVPQLDEEFKLQIFVTADHDTENGMWLDLPATKHDLERTAEALGVLSLAECVYTDLQCEIPAMHKILTGRENIYDLDSLAESLQNIHSGGELPKFKAILELEPCADLADLTHISENTGSYKWLHSMESTAHYGETLFLKLNGLSHDSAGMDCVDFEKFGTERMKLNNVQTTAYGMVKLVGSGQILARTREMAEADAPKQAEAQKPAEPSMTMSMGW